MYFLRTERNFTFLAEVFRKLSGLHVSQFFLPLYSLYLIEDEVVDRERVPSVARASANATARSTKASRLKKWPFWWIKPDASRVSSRQSLIYLLKYWIQSSNSFHSFLHCLVVPRMDSEFLFQTTTVHYFLPNCLLPR